MTNFPVEFGEAAILTSGLGKATDEALKFLEEKGYQVLAGLDPKLAKDIINMALEPHIKEYCPNDCTVQRFASLESTRQWLKGGRAVFTLVKKDSGQAVGYGWVGAKTSPKVPGGETTFALRIGQAGLGQKLSVPFSRAIIGGAMKLYDAKNIWLETWESNAGATHVYDQLGFRLVDKKPSHRQTADGQSVEDTRLFMSLPNDKLL